MCLKIIILEGKKAFLDFKITKLKKSQSRDFSKGVSPWFWSKFSNRLFLAKSDRKKFEEILGKKKAFLDSKIRKFKESKHRAIFKGVSQWV